MKKILFIFNGRLSVLPPFQALIDSLIDNPDYSINVVSSEAEDDIDIIYESKGIHIIHFYYRKFYKNWILKILMRIKRDLVFYFKARKIIRAQDYNVLWIIHEQTAISLYNLLNNRKYILSSYELHDESPWLQRRCESYSKNATINIACEYNRAQIMQVWYKLNKLPFVIPNKPFNHPQSSNIHCKELEGLEGKKIILYQGYFSKERNLDTLCAAISRMNDFHLVLMGWGDTNELVEKYTNVTYIGYHKAPLHLKYTSNAYIGIVTYRKTSLNTLYCAPNKIWEYAGFGIPMIGNDLPGLQDTIGKYNAGICIDTDDEDSIAKAIKEIDINYSEFSRNAKAFYESFNHEHIVKQILEQYDK